MIDRQELCAAPMVVLDALDLLDPALCGVEFGCILFQRGFVCCHLCHAKFVQLAVIQVKQMVVAQQVIEMLWPTGKTARGARMELLKKVLEFVQTVLHTCRGVGKVILQCFF